MPQKQKVGHAARRYLLGDRLSGTRRRIKAAYGHPVLSIYRTLTAYVSARLIPLPAWSRCTVVRTSPSPVSVAEHRVLSRVVQELPDLLRTAASHADFGGPLKGLFPRGHVNDRETAEDLLSLGVGAVGDRPVGGHNACPLALQPGAEDPRAGVHRLLDHLVRGCVRGGHVLVGDVVH